MKKIVVIFLAAILLSIAGCKDSPCEGCYGVVVVNPFGIPLAEYKWNYDSVRKNLGFVRESDWCKFLDEYDGQSIDTLGVKYATLHKSCE
jgi:hypothetical protein